MKLTHLASLAFVVACTSFSACRTVAADEPAISTDRPGFLFSPALVPQGSLQLETGASYARTAGVDAWGALAAWRYGLTPRVELRATVPNVVGIDAGGSDAEGLGDTEVGAKVAIGKGGGLDSSLALIGSLRLPTGEDELTAGQPGYGAFAVGSYPVGGVTLVGLAGWTRTPICSLDAPTGQLGVLASRSFADDVGGYVEYTAFPALENSVTTSYAGVGLAWLPQANVQVDLSADFGLDDDASDVIAGLGFSIRW